jgi:hypothetical protein
MTEGADEADTAHFAEQLVPILETPFTVPAPPLLIGISSSSSRQIGSSAVPLFSPCDGGRYEVDGTDEHGGKGKPWLSSTTLVAPHKSAAISTCFIK